MAMKGLGDSEKIPCLSCNVGLDVAGQRIFAALFRLAIEQMGRILLSLAG